MFDANSGARTFAAAVLYSANARSEGSESRVATIVPPVMRLSSSKTESELRIQVVAASVSSGLAFGMSRYRRLSLSGKFTSRIATSGARTNTRRVFPSGFTKIRRTTVAGMSCASPASGAAKKKSAAAKIEAKTLWPHPPAIRKIPALSPNTNGSIR